MKAKIFAILFSSVSTVIILLSACATISPEVAKFKQIKVSAEAGDAGSQFLLGEYYRTGMNVDANSTACVFWLNKAADQGHLAAQKKLADIYLGGAIGIGKSQEKAVRRLKQAAGQGDLDSQMNLATLLLEGKEIKRDVINGVQWLKKAGEQGNHIAWQKLANIYEKGDGIPKNLKAAAIWHRKLADKGNTESQKKLALWFESGLGVDKNIQEAKKWYVKIASRGDGDASLWMGTYYLEGKSGKKDIFQAATWFDKSAKTGNEQGRFKLVELEKELPAKQLFDLGLKFKQNTQLATRWIKKAAETGLADAQFEYGIILGKKRQYKEAAGWYHKAADQNHFKAQINLGTMYENGQGVKKDYQEAEKWYLKSTSTGKSGFGGGFYNVALFYEYGRGRPADAKTAAELYRKAAERRHIWAAHNLGVLYHNGKGVKRNIGEAIKWYEMAGDYGYPDAFYNLHEIYFSGNGVARDLVKSVGYLNLACSLGKSLGRRYKSSLGTSMNPDRVGQQSIQRMIRAGIRPQDLDRSVSTVQSRLKRIEKNLKSHPELRKQLGFID